MRLGNASTALARTNDEVKLKGYSIHDINMSTGTEELFRKAAGRVLDSWTALQLAVEHGMGGSDGHAKARNIIDSVADLFKNNANVDWQDVADLLTDLMDEEFNTLCEDDSCDEVGFLLWEFYKQCMTGDVGSVEAEMSKLPSAVNWLSKSLELASKPHASERTDGSPADSEDETEQMDVDPDPGWTKVTRKKR